jgi:hypothetical protein
MDREVVRLERAGHLRLRQTRTDCQIAGREHDILDQVVGDLRLLGREVRRQRQGGVTLSIGAALEQDAAALDRLATAGGAAVSAELGARGRDLPELALSPESAARATLVYRAPSAPAGVPPPPPQYVELFTGRPMTNEFVAHATGGSELAAVACLLRDASGRDACGAALFLPSTLAGCAPAGLPSTRTPAPSGPRDTLPTLRLLAWDANDDHAVGYRVLIGTDARSYIRAVDVGPALSWAIDGLARGGAYVLAVEAYGADGQTSPPSNEVRVAVSEDGRINVVGSVSDSIAVSDVGRAVLSVLPPASVPGLSRTALDMWRRLVRVMETGTAEPPRVAPHRLAEDASEIVDQFFWALLRHPIARHPEAPVPEAWRALVRSLAFRLAVFLLPADADAALFEWATTTGATDLDPGGELPAAVSQVWHEVAQDR